MLEMLALHAEHGAMLISSDLLMADQLRLLWLVDCLPALPILLSIHHKRVKTVSQHIVLLHAASSTQQTLFTSNASFSFQLLKVETDETKILSLCKTEMWNSSSNFSALSDFYLQLNVTFAPTTSPPPTNVLLGVSPPSLDSRVPGLCLAKRYKSENVIFLVAINTVI